MNSLFLTFPFFSSPFPSLFPLPRDLTSGLRKIRCAEIKLGLYYPAKKESAAATITTTAPISPKKRGETRLRMRAPKRTPKKGGER
jgi:hypothetical protein